MKRITLALCLLAASVAAFVFVEKQAQAQALQLVRPFTGTINKAVSSSIAKRVNGMGFAANDPVYLATLDASQAVVQGAVAAGSVAATVAAVGSAPVWLSVALGLGAVYELYDFTVGKYNFSADVGDPRLKVTSGNPVLSTPPPPAVPLGSGVITVPAALPVDYSNPGVGVAVSYPADLPLCANVQTTTQLTNSTYGTSYSRTSSSVTLCGVDAAQIQSMALQYMYKQMLENVKYSLTTTPFEAYGFTQIATTGPGKVSCTINPLICPEGVNYSFSQSHQGNVLSHPEGSADVEFGLISTVFESIFNNPNYTNPNKKYAANDAVAKLDASDLNSLADLELLAAIANKIWQQAAQQPGYQGAPYDVNNPVTAADVAADIAAGAYPHPKVGDLATPVAPSSTDAPVFDPAAQPVQAPAGESVTVDFGADPAIAQPTLEATPTGSSIVQHVMGLLPSFSAFTIPGHVAECHMPSFDFYGTAMSMQGACDLVEPHRALLTTIFSAVWGVAAFALVLRA
jgi:hypothetical protein